MLGNNKDREAARSIFTSSIKGLANVGAAGVAFFATPETYGATVGWVREFTARNYGYGWSDVTDIAWFLLLAFLTFFVARASVSTLLMVGGLAIASRLL